MVQIRKDSFLVVVDADYGGYFDVKIWCSPLSKLFAPQVILKDGPLRARARGIALIIFRWLIWWS